MPGPGWYPDPQDATSVRWFDGENWSEYRQPATESSGPSEPDTPATALTSTASSFGAANTAFDPYTASAAYGTGGTAGPTATELLPDQRAAAERPSAAPHAHAGGGRAKLDRRLLIIVGVVVVVLAVIITGGVLLFSGGNASFSYQGKTIRNASAALSQAETNLNKIASERNGTASSSARCYFAVPKNPTTASKSDIDSLLRCGPVLFVDGDTSKEYLSFGFTTTPAGNFVTIAPQPKPQSDSPDAVPANLDLKRPDGKKPPVGNGGLLPPPAPAAAANLLTQGVVTQPAGTSPITAIIGSFSGGIAITDIGKITRFGSGDNARSAPSGEHLYAFKVAGAAGNNGTVTDLSSSTTLVVDDGSGRALPVPGVGDAIVAAVSDSAKSVNLVLTDGSLKQTFSLLTGKPGADNIQVLARSHRSDTVNQSVTATYNYSTKVVFADHVTGQSQTATITLATATLAYRDDMNAFTASAPDKALLIPDLVYTGSHDGGPYGVDTSLLTFTPTGGAAITAKNISTDPSKIRNVFEVPANVTSGTITIGGTATETFSGSASTYTVTVAAPMSFSVDFPAG